MIKIDGNLDEDLLKDGWVACEIKECTSCRGTGWGECWGESEYERDVSECEWCNGSGYILDLDTAIACKVKTTVEIT